MTGGVYHPPERLARRGMAGWPRKRNRGGCASPAICGDLPFVWDTQHSGRDRSYAILAEDRVARHEREPLDLGLRDEKAVERIPVVGGQRGHLFAMAEGY